MEVEAEAILNQPYRWFPRQHGNLLELKCDHVPPHRKPESGKYTVILVGENQEWTERYRALGHASRITQLYLRRYYADRAVKVIIDSTEGRHVGIWNGKAWSKSPALDGIFSTGPLDTESESG